MNFASLFPARLSASYMTDVMVDIETTGTNPDTDGMIQLAAIQFNYDTQEIGPVFNRCLDLPPNRRWSESTRSWWAQQKPGIIEGIIARAEDPIRVMNDYFDFVRNPDRPLRFWSRGAFDFNFVESYLNQFCLPMPHKFHEARELRSFQAGLNRKASEPDLSFITAPGDAHDALHDCVVQLKRLFSAANGIFHEILPPEGVNA